MINDNNGDMIVEASWLDVRDIIHKGGTVIGSSRSAEFRTFEGRQKAARNLIKYNITHLVVVGGDGSLRGANILSNEWPEMLHVLIKTEKISEEQARQCSQLCEYD